jgi:hypothetical protein
MSSLKKYSFVFFVQCVHGMGRLLYESVKHVQNQFHSRMPEILQCALALMTDTRHPLARPDPTANSPWQAAVGVCLENMAEHVRPEHSQQLYDPLLEHGHTVLALFVQPGSDNEDVPGTAPRTAALEQHLRALCVAVGHRGGNRLYTPSLTLQIYKHVVACVRAIAAAADKTGPPQQWLPLCHAATDVLATLWRVRSRLLMADPVHYTFFFADLPVWPVGAYLVFFVCVCVCVCVVFCCVFVLPRLCRVCAECHCPCTAVARAALHCPDGARVH